MVVQQLAILVFMQEKMSSHPSTSPSRENEVINMLLEKNREIPPEGMKTLSQSRNNTQFWMCLVVKVKSDTIKDNFARKKIKKLEC